jgi:hypothetical protein
MRIVLVLLLFATLAACRQGPSPSTDLTIGLSPLAFPGTATGLAGIKLECT